MMSLALLKESVKEYKRRGVSVSKLVLALPWFGMDWVVKHPSAGNTEYIASVASLSYDVIPASKREGGGCNASTPKTWWHERGGCYQFTCRSPDRPIVPGQKALYPMHCATAMGLLRVPGAVDLWDDESATRYIRFDLRSENGTVVHHEAWYDDARSLGQKYEYAREAGVQGIGMWTANDIDNSNSSQVASFWGAIRKFLPDAAPRGNAGPAAVKSDDGARQPGSRRLVIFQGRLQALGATPEAVAASLGEADTFVLSHAETLDYGNGCLDAGYPGGMGKLIKAIRQRNPLSRVYGYIAGTSDAPAGTKCGQSPAAANWSCPAGGCPCCGGAANL